MQSIADECNVSIHHLSLNDPAATHVLLFGNQRIRFKGFGCSKTLFAMAAYRSSRRMRLILAAHPNLAPVAWALQTIHRDARFVVIAHGIEVWSPLSRIRREALLHADLVLAPSTDTVQKIAQVQGVALERIRRLPWCLDPGFLADSHESELLRPREFPKGRVLLTVARLAANERYKGIDELIEVMPDLLSTTPDLHLVIVGDGDDLPRLQQRTVHLGISDRVVFLGSLDRHDLIACYRDCDIFALPSAGEGFGLVFLEAMALAKPVVGGAHGGTPDIIEDGVTGYLVQHGDLAQLQERLQRLLTDDLLRRRMGVRGLERVLCDFTFDRFSHQLTMLLKGCLGS